MRYALNKESFLMPHRRSRYLEPLIKRGLSHKGIVGVFGHRQVGKSTLIEALAQRYSTLDRITELTRANENPSSFIHDLCKTESGKNVSPVAIDECQLAPSLFPEIKEYVRLHPKPGQFLLSGSVRFTSKKAIRESLTGRLLTYELLPFSVSELESKPINTLLLQLMNCKDFRSFEFETRGVLGLKKNKQAQKYLIRGGLPGICFVRDDRDRSDLLNSQLQLILDRDLRLICDTEVSFSRLFILTQILAQNQNRPLNLSELSRKARISSPTLRKILAGLESIFMIRILHCEGNEVRPVLFFEDQGEAHFLASGRYDSMDDLERLAYSHLRTPLNYEHGLQFRCFQYRQQGGAYIPFVFEVGKQIIGFDCSLEERSSLSQLKSAGSLRAHFPRAKVVHLHPGRDVQVISGDECSLPIELFL